ncbi:MAG: flagellar export chaperone FlgN [Deltaproteobacteria bacterium]|nr:flagellar export chaperone FlgN [Deltaproteobacteria bacterium]
MDASIQIIEETYKKKIALFSDLLNCVERERLNLMNLNAHNLWSLLEEKQRIIRSIEELGSTQEMETKDYNIPQQQRKVILNLREKLSRIKEELRVRVHENVTFIRESLDCFHEIISIFSTAGRDDEGYLPKKAKRKQMPSLMYQNEV